MAVHQEAELFLAKRSAYELAILGMSTPHSFGNEELAEYGHGLAFDKSAYNWAVVIVLALEKHLKTRGFDTDFDRVLDGAIDYVDDNISNTKIGGMYKQSEIGLIKDRFFTYDVRGRVPPNREVLSHVAKASRDLEAAGLIKDPFVETFGGLPLMVLGMIPVSFTRRTEEGDLAYTRISALMWEYEFSKKGTEINHYFSFKVFKAIEYFKKRVRLKWVSKDT